MLEVEVKLAVTDLEELTGRLAAAGFLKKDTVHETDLYFTSEAHDMIRRDEALRIRTIFDVKTQKSCSVLTFKGKKQDKVSMTRAEYETEIADEKIAAKILEGIGFTVVQQVKKVRTTYVQADITACVDRVEGLGDFLEVEILTEEGNRAAALHRIEGVLAALGRSMEETTRNSYLSMLMKITDE